MKARWKNSIRVLAIVMICFAMFFSNISLCKVNKTSHNKNVLVASTTNQTDCGCTLRVATDTVSLKKGSTVKVNLYFKEIMTLVFFGLEYEKSVFEPITYDDITMDGASPNAGYDRPWALEWFTDLEMQNSNTRAYSCSVVRYISDINRIKSEEGYVCTFHLKVKKRYPKYNSSHI